MRLITRYPSRCEMSRKGAEDSYYVNWRKMCFEFGIIIKERNSLYKDNISTVSSNFQKCSNI